jgi:hypothetical protein
MKPKTNEERATPYERLQDQVVHSRRPSLEVLLDFIGSKRPTTIKDIRFGNKSVSMTLRWPFLLPLAGDPAECLGTPKARALFRKGLRKRLSGAAAGKHLSNALFKELRAFTIQFTGGHRWGERVLDGLNSVGERRMAGRRGSTEIEKDEANHIRRQAQIILPKITEISHRAKFWKTQGPIVRKRILKRYNRDPWIDSLFPALRDLHGAPTLDNLDRSKIRQLVAAIIQKERYIESGTLHSLGAIRRLLRGL